ncbi:SpoVK/Ycf46/Vps4 family AAA+-type ATPase [Tumebacillus sp. BK434]|uniref:AAA family ATPase n=1 Tax=Tumebacillus sp. BK434 TaxID=2512169 RepID=UPI001042D473|nr:AAA family ATPase [Tumebacillus sp. BK434]TCP58046.1 SpoVK/Ycf46/Vps4 family AAA+-type ATPase [Tumebacillus sp. BK434]
MEAVKATVDAAHWLSAVEDITVRSGGKDREHTVLLRLDAVKQTLSLMEEDADSLYRITMPAELEADAMPRTVTCKLAARKLAPLRELFAQAKERNVTCIVRKNTLSLKRGEQHLLLPNLLVKKAMPAFKLPAHSEATLHFVIPDHQPLCRALELCPDTALRVRIGGGAGGVITVHDQAYPVDSRSSGLYLWPRTALFQRLSQLPARCKLHVTLSGQQAVSFATVDPAGKAGVQREFIIKPYPLTNLYIAVNKAAAKPDDSSPWKSAQLSVTPDKKRGKRTALPSDGAEDDFAALHLNPRHRQEKALQLPSPKDDPLRNTSASFPAPEPATDPASFQKTDPETDLATDPPTNQATVPQNLPDNQARSIRPYALPPDLDRLLDVPEPPKPTALEELQALPGLLQVKKQVCDIAQFAAFEKERLAALGIARKPPTLHMAFLGNPGTGKTVVARMIGRIYKELGLLSKGHVVEVDRSALVGAYMGHTEQNLTKYTRRAQGGVLFIDEAYTLYKKDSAKDFGLTAINGLVKLLEDHREDLVVIVAGYKKQMDEFFSFNQGLRERIPFHVDFPDYTDDELLAIADYLALQDHYQLTAAAKDALLRRALREQLDDTFGNARTIRNLLEKAKINHAVHAKTGSAERSPDAYTTLTAEDFQDGSLSETETLEDVLRDLDSLVGLEEVKGVVKQMTAVLAMEQKRSAYGLTDSPLTLHMAFTGNPGTGKTTVARLMGRILRVLGLLPKGHFVEAARKDLVAGYMGQTALKTGEKIREATGGILFIDEAYALARSKREEYGAEALATLIKEMEDKKDLLAVIFAGYTKEMEELLALNPGLKSRIRFHLHFPDYNASDLVEIVKGKAERSHYLITPEAEEKLWRFFIRECSLAGADFGNGRLAENVFERAKINLSTRLAQQEGEVDKTMLMTLTEDDFGFETGPLK